MSALEKEVDLATRNGDIAAFEIFSEENPTWTVPALRFIRFMGASNGADEAGVFIKFGRRVYIDKPKFFQWVRRGQRRAA